MDKYSDMDVLRLFRWWKRKKQYRYLGMFLLIFTTVLLMFAVLWHAGIDTFKKTDVIFGFAVLAVFAAIAIRYLVLWIGMLRLEMDKYWVATVKEKHKIRTPRRQVKGYRITAEVCEKTVEASCVKKTYYKTQVGQRILIFTTGNDVIYCVHLDV